MSIIFSKGCEYGIQATLYIATQKDRRVGIREIAMKLEIPVHFLAKILQSLVERGVLVSFKGSAGGYRLGGDPRRIHLLDVVEAIDGLDVFQGCVLGFPDCRDEHPCPVHESWGKIRSVIRDMLAADSLAALLPLSEQKIASVAAQALEHAVAAGAVASHGIR
jgi:Rrf2 family protein